MAMNIDLKEVKEYLLETNAVEEAEHIILRNVLSKSNEAMQKRTVKESLNKAVIDTNVQESASKLDNLKISDLLGALEEEYNVSERRKKAVAVAPAELSVQERQTKEFERLKLIDEVAAEELANLEKKRDWMQLKKLANKYELDKLSIITKKTETDPTHPSAPAAFSAPIPFPKNTKEAMGQLYELTEQHARKVAENRAESLAYKRELDLINKGNWSLRNSYLTNGLGTSDALIAGQARSSEDHDAVGQSRQPFADRQGDNVSPGRVVPNPERLQSILLSVATNEGLQQQQQEIENMRQRAAQTDLSLRSDPILQNMNNIIRQARASEESVDPQAHLVDRRMSVPQYLNQWLKVPEPQSQRSQPPSGPVRMAPEVAMALKDDGDSQLQSQQLRPGLMSAQPSSAPLPAQQVAPRATPPSEKARSDERVPVAASAAVGGGGAVAPTEDPAVQSLITRLMEENRKLLEEKQALAKAREAPVSAQYRDVEKVAAARSPERASAAPGALNQFRHFGQGGGMAPGPAGQMAVPFHPQGQPYSAPFQHVAPGFPAQPSGFGPYPAHPGYPAPHVQHPFAPYAPAPMAMSQPYGPPPGFADPQQQALQQLQQMAEQMERDNAKLLSQLGLAASPDRSQLGAGAAGGNSVGPSVGAPGPLDAVGGGEGRDGRRSIVDNAQLLTLERDKNRGQPKLSRAEIRHQEEMRRIQQEIERIKYQGELDIAQAEYEQSRSKRLKELEHEKWLQQQKQELQALKIQQVLAKEQRMLRLHQEDTGNSGSAVASVKQAAPGAGAAAAAVAGSVKETTRTGTALAREHAREECGVGRMPLPLDLATGITIIVDGIILPRSMQEGNLFRIALGLFDRTGKALVRLTASQWQSWSPVTGNDKQEGAVQVVKELLTRTLKLSETKVDLGNARCLLELQTKDTMEGAQKGVGWAVMPVVRSALGNDAAINTSVSKENVVLCNNTWRAVLRKSLSDPAIPDLFAPPEQAVFESWFLVRILDTTAKQQASAWSLADSLCRTEKQALELYVDVMGTHEDVVQKAAEGAKLLEKDPEIKGLFNSGSKSPIGFSTRNSAADLLSPNPGGEAAMKGRGAMAAMKAVGLFKSKSKAKLGLPNIDEEKDDEKPPLVPSSASRKPSAALPSAKTPLPPGSAQRGATPSSPAMAGFGGLSRKAPAAEPADVAEEDDKSKELLRAADDKKYWFMGKPLGPCTDKYQKGDGVDVYIDSAMFLPDNCTLSRITMRLFASDKEQIGPVHECYSLPNSPSTAPVFKFKAELRMSAFNVTATALLRIDTLDAATLLPASVGYCCFKLFATRDRTQPKTAAELNACVNTGNFQIPIRAGRVPSSLVIMSDTMLDTLPKVPAASLLVRILPAPKSADGISTLSKGEYPPTEWARLGLDVPAPTYVSGEYNGSLCEPSDMELVCYRAKSQLPSESVESALLQAITARPTEAISLPPKPTGSDADDMLGWIKQLLPPHDQMRRSIEYAYAIPYSLETGLNVAVDRLYNMPDAGIFTSHSTMYKVITSMSPPGLFYKDPPLFDGVFYTRTHAMDAHMRAPMFSDGWYDFTPSTLSSSLYLVLDVRTIRIEARKAGEEPKITVEPASQKKQYWTVLPLSMEKVPGQGHRYIASGVYHLPLLEGAVPAEDVLKAANPYKELCNRLSAKGKASTNLKVMDGGGVIAVRVMNPLLKDLVAADMTGPKPIIHTEFMEDILTQAISGSSGSSARIDRFTVDTSKLAVGGTNGGKSTAAQLPKSCQADLPALVRSVNKEFETATGLVSR